MKKSPSHSRQNIDPMVPVDQAHPNLATSVAERAAEAGKAHLHHRRKNPGADFVTPFWNGGIREQNRKGDIVIFFYSLLI